MLKSHLDRTNGIMGPFSNSHSAHRSKNNKSVVLTDYNEQNKMRLNQDSEKLYQELDAHVTGLKQRRATQID